MKNATLKKNLNLTESEKRNFICIKLRENDF